jgi:hypothetical protein
MRRLGKTSIGIAALALMMVLSSVAQSSAMSFDLTILYSLDGIGDNGVLT